MRKGTVSFLSIVGTLAVLSGVAAGLYYGSKKVREATDRLIDSIKGGSSVNPGSSESISGSTGLSVFLPQGRLFANADLGATKTVTATLAPANATNKTISWSSSDASKVAVVNAKTESGVANTLKLVSYFAGTVTITAQSYVLSSVKTSFTVSFENFIQTAALKGFYADGSESVIANGSSFDDSCGGDGFVQSDGTVLYHVGDYDPDDVLCGWLVELNGAAQASFALPSVCGGLDVVGREFFDPTQSLGLKLTNPSSVLVVLNLASYIGSATGSTAKTLSLTFGRAPALTVKTGDYVLPSSMSGGASVVF